MDAVARDPDDHLYGFILSVWRNDLADRGNAPWWIPLFVHEGVLHDAIIAGEPVPQGDWILRAPLEWDAFTLEDDEFHARFRTA